VTKTINHFTLGMVVSGLNVKKTKFRAL